MPPPHNHRCMIKYVWRIWKRTSHQSHFTGGEHQHWAQRSAINYAYSLIFYSDDPMVCSISNPDFVIYSSVVSFYLPFIVTLLVYIRIYVFLRMRRKRITFGQASGKVQPGSTLPSVVRPLSLLVFSLLLNYGTLNYGRHNGLLSFIYDLQKCLTEDLYDCILCDIWCDMTFMMQTLCFIIIYLTC